MWIDTNGCEYSWHRIVRDENNVLVGQHSDDTPCDRMEFDIRDAQEVLGSAAVDEGMRW